MASASKTPNLNLPQWLETEKPERTDFNAAFATLDEGTGSGITVVDTYPTEEDGEDGDVYAVKDALKTWTPTFKFGGNDTGLVYAQQQHGIYYRIGDFCYFMLSIRLSDRNNLTGTVTIEGLPFNSHTNRPYACCAVDFVQSLTWPSSARSLYGTVLPETNTIELRFNTTGSSGDTKVDGSMCDSGGFYIRMQGFYRVA